MELRNSSVGCSSCAFFLKEHSKNILARMAVPCHPCRRPALVPKYTPVHNQECVFSTIPLVGAPVTTSRADALPPRGGAWVRHSAATCFGRARTKKIVKARLRGFHRPAIVPQYTLPFTSSPFTLRCPGAGTQEALDDDTALDIDIAGEASLEHIVGGLDSLWARPFFSARGGGGDDAHGEESNHPGRSSSAGDGAEAGPEEGEERVVSLPRVLLSARLQGAVAMGRAPAVARALTAVVSPFGGEWMLPRARPVQVRGGAATIEGTSPLSMFPFVRFSLLGSDCFAQGMGSWAQAKWLFRMAAPMLLCRPVRQPLPSWRSE